jgi:hypothetical protein
MVVATLLNNNNNNNNNSKEKKERKQNKNSQLVKSYLSTGVLIMKCKGTEMHFNNAGVAINIKKGSSFSEKKKGSLFSLAFFHSSCFHLLRDHFVCFYYCQVLSKLK